MSKKKSETRGFQSEVKQLLHLMIHSLYSNKEIFLRELISNASDAADKLQFKALENPDIYMGDADLAVLISADKEAGTLTISDNGIGMTHEEIIENLGTIAKSGTKAFLESMGSNNAKNSQLIGQFGVGFYSAFIVSDKVTVLTRSATAKPEEAVLWESTGGGEYTLSSATKEQRGTEITLHLRAADKEFLDEWHIRSIINKYSDHISLAVKLQTKENDEVKWETINKAQALWTRNKSKIEDEEYKEFYKHISHDISNPLIWSHNRVEGKQDYTSLLYIPAKAPWDLWNRDYLHGLKLYVQRVFIMDDARQFMPNYLRFVKGLVDSSDLPLNVSREILQDNKITQSIRSACTKRALQMLEKLAKNNKDEYQQFWNEFGLVIKEGTGEDITNRETIIKLLRFATTHNDSNAQISSIEDYISRMKDGQDKIYYITADSYSAAQNSPHLGLFRKKGLEVILLSDRIDEWMMNNLTEFGSKSFLSINKADESLEKLASADETEDQKEAEKKFESFIERVKTVLGDKVKDVKLTHRLTDTPAVITTAANEMSTQMAKLFSAAGQPIPEIKYTFEINLDHSLIKQTAEIKKQEEFNNWIELLFDQAMLAERGSLDNPHSFIQRMNQLLIK